MWAGSFTEGDATMPNQREFVDASEEVSITVNRSDLRLIRSALEEFLASFSHEEGEVVDRIKRLLDRLPDGHGEAGKHRETSAFQRLTL